MGEATGGVDLDHDALDAGVPDGPADRAHDGLGPLDGEDGPVDADDPDEATLHGGAPIEVQVGEARDDDDDRDEQNDEKPPLEARALSLQMHYPSLNLVKECIVVIKTFIPTLARCHSPRGISSVQVVPFSGSVTIDMSPPWALTTLRAMGRLSPVPSLAL